MIYRFEDYSLDPDKRELRRERDLVAVEPLVFDVLEFLVRNRSRIVSKDDLIAGVWDGRVVSDSTLSSRIALARQAIGDDGKRQRLIRTHSRRGFRFVGSVQEEQWPEEAEILASAASADDPASRAHRKPAIAILPFAHPPQGVEEEEFVNGLVEDITTGLAQFPWLSVIARSSSFTHKGWAVDIRHVARDLGVHYVLEGSVRRVEDRLRITTGLIDTSTGAHLWAYRFDAWSADIFGLQDEISVHVVGAIGPKLEQIEINLARRPSSETLDALRLYFRGLGGVYQWSREGMSDALSQFRKAIEFDPEFASAYGMAAYCYIQRKSYGWMNDRRGEAAECLQLARSAAQLAKHDAGALSRAAHAIASVGGDTDSGVIFVERALKLNPNLAEAWYASGWIRLFLGKPDLAIDDLTRAMRMGPGDSLVFKIYAALAYALFFAGRYDDSVAMATNALRLRPNYLTAMRGAAAGHVLAGRLPDARRLMAQVRKLDPALRVSQLSDLLPFHRSDDFGKWSDALQRAGLPD